MTTLIAHPKSRKWWLRLIGILLSIASIAILFLMVRSNFDSIKNIPDNVNWIWLLLIIPLCLFNQVLASWAWKSIHDTLSYKLPFNLHLQIWVITNAVGRLPGGIWNFIGRVYWYGKKGVMKSVTTLALLVEAILIYVSCMVVSIIDMPFVVGVDYLEWYWYLVGIMMGGLLLHPKILSWILVHLKAKPENGLKLEYHHVLLWIGYYAAIWLLGSIILCLCIGMIYPIDPQFIFVCIAAWTVSNLGHNVPLFSPGKLWIA